jgi:hypothetical protein
MRIRVLAGPLASLLVGYLTLFHLDAPWQLSALSVGVAAGLFCARLAVAAVSSLLGTLPFVAVLAFRVSDAAGRRLLELIASISGLPPFAILGLLIVSFAGISVATSSIVGTVANVFSSRRRRAG